MRVAKPGSSQIIPEKLSNLHDVTVPPRVCWNVDSMVVRLHPTIIYRATTSFSQSTKIRNNATGFWLAVFWRKIGFCM